MKQLNVISYANFGMSSNGKIGGCYTYFKQLEGCLLEMGYEVNSKYKEESEVNIILDTPRFLSFKVGAKIINKCNIITLDELKNIKYSNELEIELEKTIGHIKNKKIFLVEHGNLETLICHNYLKVIEIFKQNGNDITILMNTNNEKRIYEELGLKTFLFLQPVFNLNKEILEEQNKKTYIFNSRIVGKGFTSIFAFFKGKIENNNFDFIFRGNINKQGKYVYNFITEKTRYLKGYIDGGISKFENLQFKHVTDNILYKNSIGLYGGQPFMSGKIEYALLEYIYSDINVLILDRWLKGYSNNNYEQTYGINISEFKNFQLTNELIENPNFKEVYDKIKLIFNKEKTIERLKILLKNYV